jgi:hypothetical protein
LRRVAIDVVEGNAVPEIDTLSLSDKDVALHAALATHMALLTALVLQHPERNAVVARFEGLVAQLTRSAPDLRMSAAMVSLEEEFRTVFSAAPE